MERVLGAWERPGQWPAPPSPSPSPSPSPAACCRLGPGALGAPGAPVRGCPCSCEASVSAGGGAQGEGRPPSGWACGAPGSPPPLHPLWALPFSGDLAQLGSRTDGRTDGLLLRPGEAEGPGSGPFLCGEEVGFLELLPLKLQPEAPGTGPAGGGAPGLRLSVCRSVRGPRGRGQTRLLCTPEGKEAQRGRPALPGERRPGSEPRYTGLGAGPAGEPSLGSASDRDHPRPVPPP